MEGIDFEEVFGVETPEEEGQAEGAGDHGDVSGGEQEPDAPDAPEPGEEGENEREPAEPAEAEEHGAEQDDLPKPQTPEENARYAAIRRRAEEEARVKAEAAAREAAARELDAVIAGAGLSDPYTGAPITNSAELRAYRERYEQEKRREFQEGHGMDEQSYRAFVEELPEVRAAREAAEQLQAREVKARIEEALREIPKLDPSVRELADLAKRPEYGQVCGLVEKGYRLSDAWKVTNFDALSKRAAEAARQETRNSLGGKQHLAPTASRGEGAATVPPEVAEEYRQLMPDATDAEIRAHYARYAKQSGL